MLSAITKQLIEETFQKQNLLIELGAKLTTIELHKVVLNLPKSKSVIQQHGFFHGGVISTLADTAAGLSAYTTLKDLSHSVITIQMKINFLRPADGQQIQAIGSVLKDTKSFTVAIAQVYTSNKLCAYMTQTVKKNIDGNLLHRS